MSQPLRIDDDPLATEDSCLAASDPAFGMPMPAPSPPASRPDALDKAVLALTIYLWAGHFLLFAALLALTSSRSGDPSLAVRAAGDVAGILLCLGVYALLRRSGQTRPWRLLSWTVASSVPLSVALGVACELGAGLPSTNPARWADVYHLVWSSFDYLWVLLTWSALLVGIMAAFEIRRRDRHLVAMREAAQQAQLLALRLQINPHFLFNTLNTLAGYIVLDRRQESERMVLNLSRFLRHSLTRTPCRLVCLSDEIDMLRMYLEIEKARFGDRLAVRYDVPDDCLQALVPGLLLLPLAENSITYALANAEDGIEIRIGARREDETLVLWLEDSGATQANGGQGLGIGLSNTRQQLATLFGDAGSLEAGPTPHGWRNRLRIPWQEASR
ncbi:MAG: sensor histidine kinase [Luteimonas sp.]